jgi:5'-3' exonuclease
LQTVVNLRSGFDRVAICCDESLNAEGYPYRGQSWRKWVEPNYKFNRDPMDAAYFDVLRKATDWLYRNGCTIFWAPEVSLKRYGGPLNDYYAEADDVLASLASYCATKPTHELVIYSADKDLLQCVRDDVPVRVLRDREGELWDEARVTNHLVKAKEDGKDVWIGVAPQFIPHVQALAREGADNFAAFPGWTDPPPPDHPPDVRWEGTRHPGIGMVSAVRLFRDQGFKSVADVVEAAATDSGKISKHIKEVIKRAGPNAAVKGWQLAKLIDNLPMDFSPLLETPKYRPSVATRDYLVEGEAMAEEQDDALTAIDQGIDEAKQKEDAAAKLVGDVTTECILAGKAKDKARYEQAIIALKAGFESMGMTALVANAISHVKAAVKEALAAEPVSGPQPVAPAGEGGQASQPSQAPAQAASTSGPAAPAGALTATVVKPAIVEATPAYMRAAKPQTALAAPKRVNRFALQPQSWNALWTMAECLCNSGLYQHLGTPEKVAAVIMEANERGMTAATACRLAHVVNGKVGWAASAMMAWVEDSGLVDYLNVIETTHEHCKIEFKRSAKAAPVGQVVVHTVTIEDARRAGYLGDKGYPVWKTDPKAMLVAFCKRTCCRIYFDRIVANVYTPDELDTRYNYDVAA